MTQPAAGGAGEDGTISWSQWPQLQCGECRAHFELSERVTRAWLRGENRGTPLCPECRSVRAVGPPEQEHFDYWKSLPREQLDAILRHVSLLVE